jgi:hypothetical protein
MQSVESSKPEDERHTDLLVIIIVVATAALIWALVL